MYSKKTISSVNSFAKEYESYIINSSWIGPELIFNEICNFTKKRETILDLGIGTCLSSLPFFNAGMNIIGIDGSNEMLKICTQKQLCTNVICYDLSKGLPEIHQKIDHVISHALFHMIMDISLIFKEVHKIISTGKIFAYTYMPYREEKDSDFIETSYNGVYQKESDESGVYVFRHSDNYIQNEMKKKRFEIIKKIHFTGFHNTLEDRKVEFMLIVARKI